MRLLLCIAVLFAGLEIPESAPQGDVVVFHAKEFYDGVTLQANRTLILRDGVVEVIGGSEIAIPADAHVVSASLVLPAYVCADSALAAGVAENSVTPDLRASDGFDPLLPPKQLRPAITSGIGTIYLSPGRNRLVPGLGAALRASSSTQEILPGPLALHSVVTSDAYAPPAVYEPPVPPGPDNPIRPAIRQYPTTRAGAFTVLRDLFAAANEWKTKGTRPHVSEGEPDLQPFVLALQRKIPWRVRADLAADISEVIEIATRFELRLVIEGGTEAWKVAGDLAKISAGVVLESGIGPASKLDPVGPFPPVRGERNSRGAGILAAAGVKLALIPPQGAALSDLLFYAADAMGPGFPVDALIRALTSDAAALIGVNSGSITVGTRADLLAYDVNPLRAGSKPQHVVLGGKFVVQPPKIAKAAAAKLPPQVLMAKRLYVGDGSVLEPAMIVIEDGKISSVSKSASFPPDAVVHSLGDSMVMPGLIDAGGQVGLRGYRDAGEGQLAPASPLPSQGLDLRPSSLFDPNQPDVQAARAAGVTTLALCPNGGRPVAGALSIVKLDGESVEASTLREIAGIWLDHTQTRFSEEEVDRVRKSFEAGKKYAESFEKYEKDLKEWKTKNPDAAKASERKVEAPPAPPKRDPLSGKWAGEVEGQNLPEPRIPITAEISSTGTTAKGKFFAALLPKEGIPFEGTFEGTQLSFDVQVDDVTLSVKCTVLREEIRGTFTGPESIQGTIFLERTGPLDPPAPEKKPDDKKSEEKPAEKKDEKTPDEKKPDEKKVEEKKNEAPKPPRKSQALEPYRAIIAGDIPVFLSVRSERLARKLLAVLRDEFEVRTVLLTPELIPGAIDIIDDLGVALLAERPTLREEEGVLLNPLRIATRRKIPVLFRSGPTGDPRLLYSQIAHAVHQGLDADDAVKAATRWAALVLNIQDRVGSVERGKDADLLILSGEPFQPGTKIERVMVNGRFDASGDER